MNKGIIIAGLVVFLVAVTFPVWYTPAAGGAGERKQPIPPNKESKYFEDNEYKCIEEKVYMTGNHMQLLDEWRNTVVRDGKRYYTSRAYGKEHEISLTRTCLGCHTDRTTFCNKCHDYANVFPNCWNCHVEPKGN